MAGKKTKKFQPSLDIKDSRGDRIAVSISNILGSLPALLSYAALLMLYLLWNLGLVPGLEPVDHSPFNRLDTILSATAIFLTVAVLISQNRQRRLGKVRQQVGIEPHLKC